jgi:hypothetical protein
MISASADVGDARLSAYIGYIGSRLRHGRQLQHACILTCAQMREQHDPTIGKLKGIMVRVPIVQVHLPKPSHRVTDVLRLSLEKAQLKSRNLTLDFAFERDFRARKKAHGHLRLSNGGKPASRGIPKLRRDQLISDRRWPGCNMVQTVITHGMELLSVSAPANPFHFSKDSRPNHEARAAASPRRTIAGDIALSVPRGRLTAGRTDLFNAQGSNPANMAKR